MSCESNAAEAKQVGMKVMEKMKGKSVKDLTLRKILNQCTE